MKFPLTEELLDEAKRYALRSSCQHCLFFVAEESRCAHGWPDEGESRWPLDKPDEDGKQPTWVAFCKEFELA